MHNILFCSNEARFSVRFFLFLVYFYMHHESHSGLLFRLNKITGRIFFIVLFPHVQNKFMAGDS